MKEYNNSYKDFRLLLEYFLFILFLFLAYIPAYRVDGITFTFVLCTIMQVIFVPLGFYNEIRNKYAIDDDCLIIKEHFGVNKEVNFTINIRDIDKVRMESFWRHGRKTIVITVGAEKYPLRAYTHRKELYKKLVELNNNLQ